MADSGTLVLVGLAFLATGIVIGILIPRPQDLGYEPIDTTYVCDTVY